LSQCRWGAEGAGLGLVLGEEILGADFLFLKKRDIH